MQKDAFKLLDFIKESSCNVAIKYASQILYFIIVNVDLNTDIYNKIIEIYSEEHLVKRDYISIITSKLLESNKYEDKGGFYKLYEIDEFGKLIIKTFIKSSKCPENSHIYLFFSSKFIVNMYMILDGIKGESSYKNILLNDIFSDESNEDLIKYCDTYNYKYLNELDIYIILNLYEEKKRFKNIIKNIELNETVRVTMENSKKDINDKFTNCISNHMNVDSFDCKIVREINKKNLDFFEIEFIELIKLTDEKVNSIFNCNDFFNKKEEEIRSSFFIFINQLILEQIDQSTLTVREKDIFKLRYGFENDKFHTLDEIGRFYGVTRERIRQILDKCKRKFSNSIIKNSSGIPYILNEMFIKNNILTHKKLIILVENSKFIELYATILGSNIIDFKKIMEEKLLSEYKLNKSNYIKRKMLIDRKNNRLMKMENNIINGTNWPSNIIKITDEKIMNMSPMRSVNFEDGIGISGEFYSDKVSAYIQYESSLEQKFLLGIENLNNVKYYVTQPFKISYRYNNENLAYYPDIFILLADGRGIVVEIKPMIDMGLEKNICKYNALKNFCEKNGYGVLYTDTRKTYESYQKEEINIYFEKDLLSRLEFTDIGWHQCQEMIYKYNAMNSDICKAIIRNRLIYNKNPFTIKLNKGFNAVE